MKFIFLVLPLVFCLSADAQKRGDPKIYYWTIWFKTIGCVDSKQKIPSYFDSTRDCSYDHWVQSFFDPYQATNYYNSIKYTGKVLIWNKYLSRVDTSSVYIDSFNINTRIYSYE